MTEHEKIQEIIRKKRQAPVALDPRRTALIIVDVQRFFTRPESEFAQVFQKLAPGTLDGGNREDLSCWLKEIRKRSHRST